MIYEYNLHFENELCSILMYKVLSLDVNESRLPFHTTKDDNNLYHFRTEVANSCTNLKNSVSGLVMKAVCDSDRPSRAVPDVDPARGLSCRIPLGELGVLVWRRYRCSSIRK